MKTGVLSAELKKLINQTLTLPTPLPLFPRNTPKNNECIYMADRLKRISTDLYTRNQQSNNIKRWIIHDGPPFANGDLHIGHALNKFLKDTILRHYIKKGYQVTLRPGWDCHGLPIELKAIKERASGNVVELRKKCEIFANQAIERQRDSMKNWGLLANYEDAILTMHPSYEARQLEIFAQFVEKGLVNRQARPIYWSPSSQTALAEAEIEYLDYESTACYVSFPVLSSSKYPKLNILIWTTTPWTLFANQAIAFNPNIKYCVIELLSNHDLFIVNESRIPSLEGILGEIKIIERNISASSLIDLKYVNKLTCGVQNVISADFVSEDEGTGLVHLAPSHGPDDFIACQTHGITADRQAIDKYANLDPIAGDLQGLNIFDQSTKGAILQKLKDHQMLLHQHSHSHRYPHDWRTGRPIIFMNMPQWFISIEDHIQEHLRDALESVTFYPPKGKERLLKMIEGRRQWCISRQRSWGLPIPVFYNTEDGTPLLKPEIIRHLAKIIELKGGSNVWWECSNIADLLPDKWKYLAEKYRRGIETMDVWFDSGSFWHSNKEPVADVYLEGRDQFRGWFQSSLINSVVASNKAPFKRILSHGFVLDVKGSKMSKSLGNVIDPDQVIKGNKFKGIKGVDVIRLWALSADYSKDVVIGEDVLKQAANLRDKTRNTLCFLAGNLVDFNPKSVENIPKMSIDQIAMHRTQCVFDEIEKYLNDFNFFLAIQRLKTFLYDEMSTFYFDLIKNRLYLEGEGSGGRRSAQDTLHFITRKFGALIEVISPYMADEFHTATDKKYYEETNSSNVIIPETIKCSWDELYNVKKEITSLISSLKEVHSIKNGYQLTICMDIQQAKSVFPSLTLTDLAEIFMVAQVTDLSTLESLPPSLHASSIDKLGTISLHRTGKYTCDRCWIDRKDYSNDLLCGPCSNNVPNIESLLNSSLS